LHKKEITNIKLGDHVAQTMSIMFSDIRNFTLLSGYMTTEENFNFINSFFKTVGPIVRNHKGFIDKYIGDAILALFDTSSDDAIEAGISMIHTLETYNQGRKRAGYKPVKIGIGINTGRLMIGTIGEYGRMESTVIGEAVNLASRIESMTKMYRISFLVTENTILDLKNPDKFNFRMIEQKTIKGNIKPVTVFEIFSSDPPKIRDAKSSLAGIFEEAIPLYNLRKFEEAKQLFLQCMVKYPEDTVAQIYLERCNYHLHNETDSDWGSVANFYGKK
jgi:class 3 adenylate cyclase